MSKNVKNDAFVSAFEDALEVISEDGLRSALLNLHKDVPEGWFEAEFKGATEIEIELYLKLHMLINLSNYT